jgi:serine/threonine protein kinase
MANRIFFVDLADVWSIGCILAELFLGVPLFPGTNDLELIRVICTNLGKPAPSFINQIALEKQRIIRQLSCKPRPWSKILPDSKLPKDVEERLCGCFWL